MERSINKTCTICKEQKNIINFRKKKDNRSNTEYYNSMCKICEKKYIEEYKEKNKKRIKDKDKEYRNKNQDKIKKWKKEHKEEIKKYNKEYKNKRKQEDNLFKIICQTRILINNSFRRKSIKKGSKTEQILNCNFKTFYNHLLATFKNNYGYEWNETEKIHIDHVIPLSTAKTEKDIIKLCHYSNLQLLKAEDNLKKKDKLNWKIKKEEF